jgi:hypothetical protein
MKKALVRDKQLALVNLELHDFHGDWNYTIHPTTASPRELVIQGRCLRARDE